MNYSHKLVRSNSKDGAKIIYECDSNLVKLGPHFPALNENTLRIDKYLKGFGLYHKVLCIIDKHTSYNFQVHIDF